MPRRHPPFFIPFYRLLLLALLPAMPLLAQPVDPSAEEVGAELLDSAQTVEVEAPMADAEIARRLGDIYEATERFAPLSVEVRDGVVFLRGRTREERYREWASELARKTQDVVAVVNDIVVDRGPLWSLAPAWREALELWRQFIQTLPLLVLGAVVLGMTLLFANALSRSLVNPLRGVTDSDLLQGVLRKTIHVVVVLFGVYLFLRISGLTQVALAIISGTGLVGLVLGFAFRDIGENFLSSILISVQKPFQLGDLIEVEGNLGIVQKVTTRGTMLVDFEGNHIQLANATVYKSTIKNFTANPSRRIDFAVGIGYDASIVAAQDVALGVLRQHSAVLNDPEPTVLVEALGAATINLRVYFWIDGHRHSVFKMQSALIRLIVRAFEEAGISLPDEAREVIFPQGVPVQLAREPAQQAPLPPLAQRPLPALRQDAEREVSPAEGDLASEVGEIEKQARASRAPDQGGDILGETTPPRSSPGVR